MCLANYHPSCCFYVFICTVAVTMQAQRLAPPDMQCKDKFLVQSIVAPSGITVKDVTGDMVIFLS
jgi:hypothetical protein